MCEAKRKTYTPSFKAKVGLEAIRGIKTVNEIGQDHGVHPAQVGQWKKEILEQAGTLFETKRGRPKVEEQGVAIGVAIGRGNRGQTTIIRS